MSKNTPFVYFFYMCSFLIFLSSSHWFILWISLELNSMMFLAMLVGKKTTNEMSGAVTYFMIQSTASLVLIYSMFNMEIMNLEGVSTPKSSMLLALMIKMASVPLHSWMPAVISTLSSNFVIYLMLTAQKVMPLMMLMMVKPQISALILICLLLSSIWGPLLNLSQSVSSNIIAYSSISHTSWLICASLVCEEKWMFYFMSYSLMLLFLTKNLKKTLSQQNMNLSQSNLITMFIILMSMGGLPPLMGFFPKVVILNSAMQMSMIIISMILISASVCDLFIYTRMAYFAMINKKAKILWLNTHENKTSFILVVLSLVGFNLIMII